MKRGVLAVLALAVAGTAFAAKTPADTTKLVPLAWYDSAGLLVGNHYKDGALARVGGQVLYVAMRLDPASSLYGAHLPVGGERVYFSNSGCPEVAGSMYITRTVVPGTTRPSAVLGQATYFVPVYGSLGTPQSVTIYSATDGQGCQELGATLMTNLVPVEGIGDLYSITTPPYYLK